jgi:hypothetical protein
MKAFLSTHRRVCIQVVKSTSRYYFCISLSGVRLSPLATTATIGLLYQPQMTDDSDCGANGGMKINKGNRYTLRKPAPVPLRPPQIPHDLTLARTRASAVGSQRLTAWAMARPRQVCKTVKERHYVPLRALVFLWRYSSSLSYPSSRSGCERKASRPQIKNPCYSSG